MKKLNIGVVLSVLISFNVMANENNDSRKVVEFPKELKEHTLSNMRKHLQAIDDILYALSKDDTEKAADIAEHQLGMSSLALHGANKASYYMPLEMKKAGMRLHHKASKFALVAQEGNVTKTYGALREITLSCLNCHAQFKFK